MERRAALDAHALAPQLALRVLEALPPGCKTLAGYVAIRGEAPVDEVLAAAAEREIITGLPCTDTQTKILKFRRWQSGDALMAGAHGTAEPPPQAQEMQPDVLLVPLLA